MTKLFKIWFAVASLCMAGVIGVADANDIAGRTFGSPVTMSQLFHTRIQGNYGTGGSGHSGVVMYASRVMVLSADTHVGALTTDGQANMRYYNMPIQKGDVIRSLTCFNMTNMNNDGTGKEADAWSEMAVIVHDGNDPSGTPVEGTDYYKLGESLFIVYAADSMTYTSTYNARIDINVASPIDGVLNVGEIDSNQAGLGDTDRRYTQCYLVWELNAPRGGG